jgi:hypothetical protein
LARTWKVLAWEIAAFEPLQPDFDLGLPISIIATCADSFMVDSFCTPSFDPQIFDHKSLVFFAQISPFTDVMNCSNREGPIGFHDVVFGNLLSQFIFNDYRLWY